MAQEHFDCLWIGTTHKPIERFDEDGEMAEGYPAYEHQVSDGPVGARGSSFDFTDAREALEFAVEHADFVIIEEDFRP